MSDGDDPFGRKGDERTDAFGRPIGDEPAAEPASDASWQPPSRSAPSPAPSEGGFAPPTDAPAPDTSQWWTGAQAGTIEGRAHGTSQAGVAGVAPAEYVERAGAALLDLLVRIGITGVAVLVGAVAYLAGNEAGDVGLTIGLLVGLAVSSLVYAPYMIATRNGQTVGHKAVGIRVAARGGGPIGGGKAFVREVLVKSLLFEGLGWVTLGIATLLNYLWPLWDDKNEALHDKVCDTRMLKA